MKQLSDADLERKRLEMHVRAEASYVRLKFLNEYLPAALEEFDRRLAAGQSTKLELPTAEKMVEDALSRLKS